MVVARVYIVWHANGNAYFIFSGRSTNSKGIHQNKRISRRFHRIQLAFIRLIVMGVLIKIVVNTQTVRGQRKII